METSTLTHYPEFEPLRKNGQYTDLELRVGSNPGLRINGHRLILQRVEYFKNLLKFDNSSKPTIHLNDMDSTAVDAVIKYIYTGELDVNANSLGNVLTVAKQFGLDQEINCWRIREISEKTNNVELQAAVASYINSYMIYLARTESCLSEPQLTDEKECLNSFSSTCKVKPVTSSIANSSAIETRSIKPVTKLEPSWFPSDTNLSKSPIPVTSASTLSVASSRVQESQNSDTLSNEKISTKSSTSTNGTIISPLDRSEQNLVPKIRIRTDIFTQAHDKKTRRRRKRRRPSRKQRKLLKSLLPLRLPKLKNEAENPITNNNDDVKTSSTTFKPGTISQELRQALGLLEYQLPIHIYKMRFFGYPPGWKAKLLEEHLNDDLMQESTVFKAKSITLESMISYPGFTGSIPSGFIDEFWRFNVPPYDPDFKEKLKYRWEVDFFNSSSEKDELGQKGWSPSAGTKRKNSGDPDHSDEIENSSSKRVCVRPPSSNFVHSLSPQKLVVSKYLNVQDNYNLFGAVYRTDVK